MKFSSYFIFFSLLASFLQTASAQSSNRISAKATIYGKNEKVGRYVKIRGFNMYYEIYGNGAPLLMIHDNAGSINKFRYQIPYFSKKYKVIVADSRAQGRSTDASDSLSYEMMADDFNALLEKLHLDSCYVIGWSDGGINGLLLAIRHPDKVKKLAVTGASLSPDSTAVDSFILKHAIQAPKSKNEKKLADLLTYEPHISVKQLNQIKCPTLVIGGDHDVILTQHTLHIASSIPKSYLWILPNSGHATPIYYRDQFNKVVKDFFSKPFREITGFERFD